MTTIKDSKLSVIGKDEVDWAQRQMQVLEDIKFDFKKRKPLDGLNIGACMHVTKETANLMLTLQSAGANVALCASNPLSTKDSVAAYLSESGVEVHAIHGHGGKTQVEFEPDYKRASGELKSFIENFSLSSVAKEKLSPESPGSKILSKNKKEK